MQLYIVENTKHKECIGDPSWYARFFMLSAMSQKEAIDKVYNMCRKEYPERFVYTKEMFQAKKVEKFHEERQIDGITEF